MLTERIDQRVLGALRLVDRATGLPVTAPLRLHSDSARLLHNRSGLYVITEASGLESHAEAFAQPPASPPLASIEYRFIIEDPRRRYLPRRLSVNLPRDPDPEHAGRPDSLFTPHDALLYHAATARLSANWSSLRVSVLRNGKPLAGALLRVIGVAGGDILASGISDPRGEALVVVPGVPVTRFADEGDVLGHDHDPAPVVVNTLPVRLEVSLTASDWPVDPDELEQNHAANLRQSRELGLRTGRMETVVFKLTE